ncbi:MAG: GNAT family N-acetyltransferase [Rikenellaceae bacterium]|nr:GNAT family N-acetyltransferase [Rikenellaceae bacterium]MBQ5371446.1 GNAT family N-acetyltransferase [Rikenellaceae bacterium]MBQ5853386.1 GNAT family N-acetyltransferase [Rikenellaceae bacterium]
MNHNFNKAASVFVCTIDGNLVGFCAVLPFPHPFKKNTYKGHRTVVLPDYQGVGIGREFTNYIAEQYKRKGKTFISTTSNPAMIFARKNDPKWITTRIGRVSNGSQSGLIQNKNKKGSTSNNRITVSFEYVGNK